MIEKKAELIVDKILSIHFARDCYHSDLLYAIANDCMFHDYEKTDIVIRAQKILYNKYNMFGWD